MDELTLLQAVRLKGRVRLADLATTLDEDDDDVASAVAELTEAGLLIEGKTVRVSAAGRARLYELLTDERRDVEPDAFARAYDGFRAVNRDFKTLVSDWQVRGAEPNDHGDADYDAAVLERLDGVHAAVLPILTTVAGQLPRLDAYATRLSVALDKIKAGDATWLTRPLVDSYHTVWFELHEELLAAAGLTREGEATAGLDE